MKYRILQNQFYDIFQNIINLFITVKLSNREDSL